MKYDKLKEPLMYYQHENAKLLLIIGKMAEFICSNDELCSICIHDITKCNEDEDCPDAKDVMESFERAVDND